MEARRRNSGGALTAYQDAGYLLSNFQSFLKQWCDGCRCLHQRIPAWGLQTLCSINELQGFWTWGCNMFALTTPRSAMQMCQVLYRGLPCYARLDLRLSRACSKSLCLQFLICLELQGLGHESVLYFWEINVYLWLDLLQSHNKTTICNSQCWGFQLWQRPMHHVLGYSAQTHICFCPQFMWLKA